MATLYKTRPGYGIRAEQPTVLVPMPGKVPVGAGHWRTTPGQKPAVKPRTTPKPTGGKVVRAKGVAQYPRRRKPSTTSGPTSRQLHASWAKGRDPLV